MLNCTVPAGIAAIFTHTFADRFDVQFLSLICDPTIAKDPKRTPATISLSNLQELHKTSL